MVGDGDHLFLVVYPGGCQPSDPMGLMDGAPSTAFTGSPRAMRTWVALLSGSNFCIYTHTHTLPQNEHPETDSPRINLEKGKSSPENWPNQRGWVTPQIRQARG